MHVLQGRRLIAKPLLAAVLVGVATWAGASPAGVAPHHETVQVAMSELPIPVSSTTTTVAPTTTTTAAAPPTTAAPAPPPTTAPRPAPATPARRASGPPPTEPPVPRAPVPPAPIALPPVSPPPVRDIAVYHGLGTWVDAYDYSPEYQPNNAPPKVTADTMDAIADAGVKTLYLQAAKDDVRSPGDLVNPDLLASMLVRAHARGVKVVAWYLPKFYDLGSDMRRLLAMRDFRAEGHGFDGIGLDIEWTKDVPDASERNLRLIDLSRRLRAAMGSAALAAIPLPPVLIETVNPKYWPAFPWRELAPLYDVWMPMAYWTFRSQSSGWRDAYRYTEENVRRLRLNLGLPGAPVHPVGGTDNKSNDNDYRGYVRACAATGSIGGSNYDWLTTPPQDFEILRGVPS